MYFVPQKGNIGIKKGEKWLRMLKKNIYFCALFDGRQSMKRTLTLIIIAYIMAIGAAAVERKQCIDSNWRFMLGDGSRAVSDPRAADSWRTLSLPAFDVELEVEYDDVTIYDLNGRRLPEKPARGFYIQGGTKYLVK